MELKPKLTLLCPSIGRSTIQSLTKEVLKEMGPEDQFFVIGDGPHEETNIFFSEVGDPRVIYRELPERIGDYGCSPCDWAMFDSGEITGDFIFLIGDDDHVEPGAFNTIREKVDGTDCVHIFSMWHGSLQRMLSRTITACHVSGQQIVVPYDVSRLPRMTEYAPTAVGLSDWSFIYRCAVAWYGEVQYHDEKICHMDQMNQGRMI